MGAIDDRGPTITAFASLALACTTIAVLLRCYVRLKLQKVLSYDDYLLLFSQALYTAYIVCVFHAVKYGLGKHLMDAPDLVLAVKFFWVNQITFGCMVTVVKATILIFFCSLRPQRYLRNMAIGLAYFCVAVSLGYVTLICFLCTPIPYFWTRLTLTTKGRCLDPATTYKLLQIFNSINILVDCLLALLPCLMVRDMNMRRRQKIAVSILLGLSFLPAIASTVRCFYTRPLLYDVEDFTYVGWVAAVTEILEPGLGIIVICIARLRPLIGKLLPSGWQSSRKKSMQSHQIDNKRNIVTFGQMNARRPKHTDEVSLDELIEDASEAPSSDDRKSCNEGVDEIEHHSSIP